MVRKGVIVGGIFSIVVVIIIIIIAVTVSKGKENDESVTTEKSSFDSAYFTSCDHPARDSPQGVFPSAAVASDAVPCADVASDVLKRGGTAADAAIAGMFCVGVINGQSCGLGGGFLATYYSKKEDKVFTLDAREVAPKAAFPQMYDPNFNEDLKVKTGKWWEKKPSANLKGPLSVAVPGEVAGLWALYNKFGGGVPWKDLLQPAIKLCEEGYPLTWYTGGIMHPMRFDFLVEPSMSVYVNVTENRVLIDGEIIKKPQLGRTLRILQDKPKSFYNGEIADLLITDLKAFGGIITKEDLFDYKPEWKEPLRTHLKNGDYTLYSMPPPGGGLLVSLILKILDGYNLTKSSLTSDELYLTEQRVAESFKFSFAQRYRMGDLTQQESRVLINELISDEYAYLIRSKIKDDETSQDPLYYGTQFVPSEDEGTAHFSLVAPNGDAISVTSSINYAFGAGIRSPSTGIIFNNEMADFTTNKVLNKKGKMNMNKNLIMPGRRPLSSMSPSIVLDSERNVHLVFGAAGGIRIPSAAAWVAARYLWMGQSVKEAIDACRSHHSLIPMKLQYEKGFPKDILDDLQKRGHVILNYRWKSVVNAIGRDSDGNFIANYDYRKSGQISGY